MSLIAVARGDEPPDLVITGAQVFSAFTREWLELDVGDLRRADRRPRLVRGRTRVDAGGRWLVPGFIDAHVHIESSKLVPAEFARAVVPHGTTAVVTDPHEVGNVLGLAGVEWMLAASESLPLDVFVMAPSCVPASSFESPGFALGPADMEAILRHPRALGVAEMMNFPGVIAGDPDVLGAHRVVSCRRARARCQRACVERLRRRGSPVRPRGDDLRRGAGEAPARDVGADPRGVERAQPARPAALGARVRPVVVRVLHRRPRARPVVPRRAHRPDVPDRGVRGASPPRTRW